MAQREYKQPSIVSGLKIKDILDMDIRTFNKLSLKELRQVTGRLVSAGNKRIRAFENAGEDSPALGRLRDKKKVSRFTKIAEREAGTVLTSGPIRKFSTKGLDLNHLRSEFIRAKNFLLDKTSTLRNWKKIRAQIISELQSQHNITISEKDFDMMWHAYEKLKELDSSVQMTDLKYATLKEITNQMEEDDEKKKVSTDEEIAMRVKEKVSQIYEKQQAERDSGNGVSQFFK